MRKFYFSVGLLLVVSFPQLGFSQEAGSVPASEVQQVACDIRFELAVGDVCFPHKMHRKMGCKECHHQYQAEALETPHPDYLTSSWKSCQTCHSEESAQQKRSRRCSSCHFSDPDNIADETPSSKVAHHKSCWKCHDSGTGAEASAGCADCHIKEEK
jgi:DnaJ-class molecular chaperone